MHLLTNFAITKLGPKAFSGTPSYPNELTLVFIWIGGSIRIMCVSLAVCATRTHHRLHSALNAYIASTHNILLHDLPLALCILVYTILSNRKKFLLHLKEA